LSDSNDDVYSVIVNDEEQFSIWPVDSLGEPTGWRHIGKTGTREQCHAYIREIWVDMRPLSLRSGLTGAPPKADTKPEVATTCKVVINLCGQWSVMPPALKSLPKGWREEGTSGSHEECLGYIRERHPHNSAR
jgi:MbtH protein